MNQLFVYISAITSLTLVIIFSWLVKLYNRFTKLNNSVKTDLSDISIQLQQRASLVERLAGMVKEYATHEKETFENVAKARSALDTSKTAKDAAKAENMFTDTLRSLFMVVESYPKLQANENYKELRIDLKETEKSIARYREEYNFTVKDYNDQVLTFPNLIAAKIFQFNEAQLFQDK